MDLRARLILSLSPLLVALAIIGVVAVYSQQRVAQAVNRVDNTARDLVEVAQSESLILLEHYYVSEIIAGRPLDRNELEKIRAEARSFFATYGQSGSGYIELELVARFEAMVAQHEAALTFLDRGNQEKARELINSTDYHRNLRAIHNLSLGAQLEYDAEYQRRVAELERIANEGFWIASAVVGSAVLIALAFAVSLIWQVGKSVDQLTADAERLAHTDDRGQLSAVSSINQLQRLRDSFQYLLDTNHDRQQQLAAAIQAQQA